jgi:hypothetical protein
MKQISKWSILGAFAGLLMIIGSFARYFIIYPDLDKFVAYTFLGILAIAVSWLYNRELALSNTLDAVGAYLADKQDEEERGRRK